MLPVGEADGPNTQFHPVGANCQGLLTLVSKNFTVPPGVIVAGRFPETTFLVPISCVVGEGVTVNCLVLTTVTTLVLEAKLPIP